MSQREQLNEMKQFMNIAEGADERPYVCHHIKKGEHECTASSSYGAVKKAAEAWGLNSTAGISATLTDISHSTQFVGEDAGHSIRDILNGEELADLLSDLDKEGDIVYGASYFDKLYFHFLDTHPDEIPVGHRTGRPDDVDGYVLDNLERDYGDEVRSMIDRELDNRRHGMTEGDPDDTDWDAHWAREDGDDERADDLEADAEFARMDDELDEDFPAQGSEQECAWWAGCTNDATTTESHPVLGAVPICDRCVAKLRKIEGLDETGWGNWVGGDEDEEDEDTYIKPSTDKRDHPHTPGLNKLGSGARAAADSRAQAFMFDEDADEDGMGSYDIVWNDETWKEAIPYNIAQKEVDRILNIIDDSALQAHDNNDHLQTTKTADGDAMVWTILDPIDGDNQVIRVEPSDMPAGYTGESIELDSIVESVLEEYPGQPKDYAVSDSEVEVEDEFEQDRIDPEIEDEELGLRFD